MFPSTVEILEYLKQKNYRLHLITNGLKEVQHQKINNAQIAHFFDKVITSEAINSPKPNKQIFEFALHATKANIKESIMLGNDLVADIMGARKAGIDQVFINHNDVFPDFKPTYTVYHLKELKTLF